MDSAQHCLDQSVECRRLMKSAQSEAEARVLKVISRSWLGLAGQIDRFKGGHAMRRQDDEIACARRGLESLQKRQLREHER